MLILLGRDHGIQILSCLELYLERERAIYKYNRFCPLPPGDKRPGLATEHIKDAGVYNMLITMVGG